MLEIRPATRDDAESIDAIQHAAASQAFAHFAGRAVARLEPQAQRWRLRIAAGREVWLIADGGFVAADPHSDELAMLYVHPDRWGQGLGAALLAAGAAHLGAGAHLWTEVRNHGPRRFYERQGWVPDGRVRERRWLDVPLRELRYVRGHAIAQGGSSSPRTSGEKSTQP